MNETVITAPSGGKLEKQHQLQIHACFDFRSFCWWSLQQKQETDYSISKGTSHAHTKHFLQNERKQSHVFFFKWSLSEPWLTKTNCGINNTLSHKHTHTSWVKSNFFSIVNTAWPDCSDLGLQWFGQELSHSPLVYNYRLSWPAVF